MTQDDYQGSVDIYVKTMSNYRMSSEITSSIKDLVETARAGGSKVVFLRTPLHPGLRNLFPGKVQATQQDLNTLSEDLNAGVVDLATAVPGDPNLWVDSLHLDRAGADFFAPQLASALAPSLGG
jgi:lysophospholipase L1-like esterase